MIEEELPLFRAKLPGLHAAGATGPGVGPGSYNLSERSSKPNHGTAPFGSTSNRFFSTHLVATPGVGTYDVIKENRRKGDVTVVPFCSAVDRFSGPRADDIPGPGSYTHNGNRRGSFGRSHTFGLSNPNYTPEVITGGPGSYNPNYGAAKRANPRYAKFSGYSPRNSPRFDDIPGPGHYDIPTSNENLYSRKPTSSFATKTVRSNIGNKSITPGPGAYDLQSTFQSLPQYRTINPENFSAFGSSANRYAPFSHDEGPGPGAYTGEIAPRRPCMGWKGKGTSSFISQTDRDTQPLGSNLGPGIYEAEKPAKHKKYLLHTVPFRSGSPRFPVSKTAEINEIYEPRHNVVRVPRRIHPVRLRNDTFNNTSPISASNVSTDRVYDVKYEWTKPTCASKAYLGTAPRFKTTDLNSSFPGPGHYDVVDKSSLGGGRSANGTWGNDGRFKNVSGGTPGPGYYFYDSTLLKKTLNCTIGSSEEM
ncbi:Sperm-tail PG-rich repeat [Trypanosoma melophagium]|uniref:Sperm-tail PG-rich repeat n=1 Tax=Trypanosoma melophagium TaxID=715481 RepID=UPI003519FC44|nr:Sperm-tail PG-rich repeat [Trypanosoma melophagium]